MSVDNSAVPPLIRSPFIDDVLDTVREPFVIVDQTLRIVAANRAFATTCGVSREQAIGAVLTDLGGGCWALPELRQVFEDMVPAHQAIADVTFLVDRGPLTGRSFVLNAREVRHQDGEPPLVFIALEDVSDRLEAERAIARTMAELARSNHDLELFASVASHDLQEPLRKICAFGERLESACEGQLPEKGRDYLQRMTSAARRMQTLITDLLALARVATRAEPWRPVDLNQVVTEVIADLGEALARSGGRVDVNPLPTLEGDGTQLRQLLQNLIENAVKFRGTDAPVIRVAAASDRGTWRIDVTDNGIGFEPKHAERIFRPFERLHGRDAFEGTGIGLALCQRIARRHGGTIRAESEAGRGARFVVELPAIHKDIP